MPDLDLQNLGNLLASGGNAARYRIALFRADAGVNPAKLEQDPGFAGQGFIQAWEVADGGGSGTQALASLQADLKQKLAGVGEGGQVAAFVVAWHKQDPASVTAAAGPVLTVKGLSDEQLPAPVAYAGGQHITVKSGAVIKDIPGTIKFVKDDFPAEPDAWEQAQCSVHTHFAQAHCADVNGGTAHYPGASNLRVYGPDVPFHVLDRFTWPQTGGAVFCRIADGTTFGFGHVTEVAHAVYKAAKSGAALPPGTYLGACKATIGVSTGPHCHIQAWAGAPFATTLLTRKVWFPKMRRNGWLAPNDAV